MTLSIIMVSFYICIFVVGVSLLSKILPNYRKPEIFWLIIFVSSVCVISFCSLNVYVIDSLELKVLFSRWRFIGHGVIGPAWFFFFMLTFSKKKIFRSPFLVVPVSIIMIVTVSLAVIPGLGDLLIKNFQEFQFNGAKLVKFSNGPWFSIHIIMSYVCALTTLFFAGIKLPIAKADERKQLLALSFGVFIGVAVDIYCVYNDSPLRWAMLSGGAYLITGTAILYSVTKQSLFELGLVAKNQIFQNISHPILIIDQNKTLIDFNGSATSQLGLTKKDRYKPILEFPLFRNITFASEEQEFSLNIDDGKERFYKIIFKSFKNFSGKILFFHDITTQKEIENTLSNQLEFKARLLEIIAHDFSGVLSAQSQLSSKLVKAVSPELRDDADSLSNSTYAGKDLLHNILLWSRAQENRFQPVLKQYELNILLLEVADNLESVCRIKQVIIEIEPNERPVILTGDTIMIESIARNILTNAIRASHPGGRIKVYSFQDINHVVISVQDQGVGMNSQQLKMIQNMKKGLFTGEIKSTEGFGLGLIIADRFAKMHGGFLEFSSEEGKGTLVTLSLPL